MKSYPKGYTDIPLAEIKSAPWNYKREDAQKSAKLKENIRRNGQIENLIVRRLADGSFEAINGNHRLGVLAELGVKKAHVFNMDTVPDRIAYRIAIETNETRFDADQLKLAELLKDITAEYQVDELVATMPYSDKELGNIVGLLDFDWKAFEGKAPDAVSSPAVSAGTPTAAPAVPQPVAAPESAPAGERWVKLEIPMPQAVFELWHQWRDRLTKSMEKAVSDTQAFEFALAEALAQPEDAD